MTGEHFHVPSANTKCHHFFILWWEKFLIDPVLAPKGSWPPFPNSIREDQNNPLVELPVPVDELLKAGENCGKQLQMQF